LKRYTTLKTQHPDAALLDQKSTLKIMVAMAGGSITAALLMSLSAVAL